MRFLFLTIFIASLVFALVAIFVVPVEDRRAIMADIRNPIPQDWRPVEWIESVIEGPSLEPISQFPNAAGSIDRIRQMSGDAIGDWTFNCQAGAGAGPYCTLSQQIRNSSGIIAFSWVISIDETGQFRARWQTTTGVMVNRGIVLDAGTEQPIRLPYSSCVSGYCQADANLADDFVDTLMKTTRATATVQPINGPAVTYTISTLGLTEGLRALRNGILKS